MPTNKDWPNQHANVCDHCQHSQTDKHTITVTFSLNVERGHAAPNRMEFVEALIDGLPKEWWWGVNMADWGLTRIS